MFGATPAPLQQQNGEEREGSDSNISVVGFSLRAPKCSSVPEFARALKAGEDLTTDKTRYPHGHLGLPPRQGRINDSDFDRFDNSFFGLSHKQAEAMDPQIRMLLEVSYESLLDARLSMEQIRGSNTGVYVGHCFSDDASHKTSAFNPNKNGYELVNGTNSMAANRLSYFYDFKGPSFVIDTACSSSLVALHYAMMDLSNGSIERAIVAGLSLTLNPHKNSSFAAFKMLSPTGHCYTFDDRANGYCRSDAVVCIVLERGSNGYAMIAGTGTNSDGNKSEGITYPSAEQQATLMKQVFERERIDPNTIAYHEAHGTGTIAGDREELKALSKVYQHPMTIGSVKSNMGHSEGASGLIGLIKVLLMYEDKLLYPNWDFRKSSHSLINGGPFTVLQSVRKWEPSACSISSFGFGGSNAFAILTPCKSKKQVVTWPEIRSVPSEPFASSLSCPLPSRTCASFYKLHRSLCNHQQFQYVWNGSMWRKNSPLVFVFDGQGSQWKNMGQDLIDTNSAFRKTMKTLQEGTGIPLLELYRDGSMWLSKEYSTIGIISFQLGLLAILKEYGVRQPDYFLGHSLGEITCSYIAGFVSEVDVLRFAMVRTKLVALIDPKMRLDVYKEKPTGTFDFVMKSNTPTLPEQLFFVKKVEKDRPLDPSAIKTFSMHGQMVVVGCVADEIDGLIQKLDLKQTRIACHNAKSSQTISGPSSEVEVLIKFLQNQNKQTFIRRIDTDNIAYHAIYLEVFQDWLIDEFGEMNSFPIPTSWKSTSRNDIFGAHYLTENILRPVYFQDAIEDLPRWSTVVEIGPSNGLLSQIKRIRPDLERVSLVEKMKPLDLEQPLQKLKIAYPEQHVNSGDSDMKGDFESEVDIHYNKRYPQLWGRDAKIPVMEWNDWELPNKNDEASLITYDLSQQPWCSLRDHVIRDQCLFPATGFIHALWSGISFKCNVNITDFKIQTPLVISSAVDKVKLKLCKAGTRFEVWDEHEHVRYVSADVQILTSSPPSCPSLSSVNEEVDTATDAIEGKHFYPHIRRLGYQYGSSFQLVDRLSKDFAHLRSSDNLNWITYLDAMLHLKILNEVTFAYPVAFDRIYFKESSLSEAPLWAVKSFDSKIGNNSVLLEGLRMDYIPIVYESYSHYQEIFVEYSESKVALDPRLVASLICRESRTYSVKEPLLSPELIQVVDALQEIKIVEHDQSNSTVVLSDSADVENAQLLLTTDSKPPKSSLWTIVATWGKVKAYRLMNVPVEDTSLSIVSKWEEAMMMTKSFIWKGVGASGAAASLAAETRGRIKVLSYEGKIDDGLPGIVKGMRHNFVSEDGRHGIYVDQASSLASDGHQDLSSTNVSLQVARPGHLSSLGWKDLDPSRYSTRVSVATLNFRDVMRALGKLKEKDLSLGLEFSGFDHEKNMRVFGVAKSTLSTHCSPLYCFPTPSHFTNAEAATIPVVYLTAYFALCHKAKMEKGQSVLIHAGSGGVGIAAIRIALARGLRVFTTCSNARKRTFIKDTFGLKDCQIGDSRSDSFVETVMKGTNGEGVDIALNQLAGDLQVATFRCMAPGGHFLEIGKYDIMQNTGIGQALMASNISFHVIDLLPLLSDERFKPLWDDMLSKGFSKNEIVPLPIQEFDAMDIVNAFRFMSQGKHIGKIAITGLDEERKFPVISKKLPVQGQTHLIVGGLGGLGLSIALRLAMDGCKKILLVGRTAVPNGFQRNQISAIESNGCKVQIVKSDVHALSSLSLPEPDMIWHAATVYRDMFLSEMTTEAWDQVVQTKVEGYNVLRRSWSSTRIVVFSSVAAYFGNALQTSYALANACLDSAARDIRGNTISIRLGPLDNVGFITKGDNNRMLFDRVPFEVMNIDAVIDSIMQITAGNACGVFGIYELKSSRSAKILSQSKQQKENTKLGSSYTVKDAQKFISVILGGSPENYSADTSLKAAGLDSLSTMEVVNYIHQESGNQDLKPSDINDNFSIQSMVDIISSGKASSPESAVSPNHTDNNAGTEITMVNESYCKEEKSVDVQYEESLATEEIHHNPRVHMLVVEIAPSSIDFDAIISALNSADVIVLRQQDADIFNHGAPIESKDEVSIGKFMDNYVTLAQALESTSSIVVAVIEGEVRGGGMLFPATADLCIATSKASFGLPEIHRNMVPSVVSKALVERLGRSVTRRFSLTGESFDADNALRLGLVDNIVSAHELEEYLEGVVRRWKSNGVAPKFIKNHLLPKVDSNAAAMGTVVGTWLVEKSRSRANLGQHEVLKVSIQNNVATLTMCDTLYQNTMTFEMTAALRNIIPRLRKEAKVIILTSSLSHFHVGLNPAKAREWKDRPAVHVAANMKECYMGFVELARLGLPIIAVLNGKVYGGGMPIALWCDFRIATRDVDMHFGNISRGMSPAGQLSQLLREYLSPSDLMETYLKNSHWDCDDLLRLKIASHVASDKDEALAHAKKLASFIAKNPLQAIRDTITLVKLSYAAEVADEESWLIAKKITEGKELFNRDNASFSFEGENQRAPTGTIQTKINMNQPMRTQNSKGCVGIIAMEAYTPKYAVSADVLEHNGILARKKQGQEAVAVWDDKEDSISMAMTAVAKLLRNHVADVYSIRRVEVGTESNIDLAKSIKSYLMDLFPDDHVNVEGVDNVNACYGGAAALLNTISWCRETGGFGIVVATDTADMDLSDSSWRGASAVAMLVGPDPWIEIHPERASCFKNTSDFLKPRYSQQVTPHMQTKASMNYYIEALMSCIKSLKDDHSIIAGNFDAFIFHGGLCATFMKLVERQLLQTNGRPKIWKSRFEFARTFATHLGGLYTASLFVNLMSLLSHENEVENCHDIGLFAYGSGSTATLMKATIHHNRAHNIDLQEQLDARTLISFDVLSKIVECHKKHGASNIDSILPKLEGVYYRDISFSANRGSIERFYVQQPYEGTNVHVMNDDIFIINDQNNQIPPADKTARISNNLSALRINGQLLAALSSIAVWIWWLVTIIILDKSEQTKEVLLYGLVTFVGMLLIHQMSKMMTERGSGWLLMFTHYFAHCIVFVIFAITVSTSWTTQLKAWRPMIFGSYTFDFIGFILVWNDLPSDFRSFYCIHHLLTFIVTSLWMIVDGDWDELLVIALTIWLTSEIWLYGLILYRFLSDISGWNRMSAQQFLMCQCGAFVLERLQRIAAYTFFIWLDKSTLIYTILCSGLVLDIWDARYQFRNLCSQFN